MKYLAAVIRLFSLPVFFLFISLALNAQDDPEARIKFKGEEYIIHIGDTLQLGMGSNPDGSFMYVTLGADDSLGKEHALKKVEVRKIKYFKKMNVRRLNMFAPYVGWIYIDIIEGNISQAVEKGELILKKKP
ncbi:MAG: hypothetical protein K0R65_2978 [Crocinitomicaceae bacterium]|jgi:hypothetical protein|nr:hypothetical protein [Crocinitomicaceae bacterium]